jgi:hypothetical protein
MNGKRHIPGATTGRSRRAAAALAATIVVGLALFAVGNARAVVGGAADGGMHPNVAAIVYDGGFAGCSGFLVAPRIVVTAAHCIDIPEFLGYRAIGVSFSPTADVAGAIPLAGIEVDRAGRGSRPITGSRAWVSSARAICTTWPCSGSPPTRPRRPFRSGFRLWGCSTTWPRRVGCTIGR